MTALFTTNRKQHTVRRSVSRTRPKDMFLLLDASASMANPREKMDAATAGVQEALMEAQTIGRPGRDRNYFNYTIIEFSEDAEVVAPYDRKPVRTIDPDEYSLNATGTRTNITSALTIVRDRLAEIIAELQQHPERDQCTAPLVVLVSDGCHNVSSESPEAVANEIKSINLDGESVVIAAAGVAIGTCDLDEDMLSRIATPECYMRVEDISRIRQFIKYWGSSVTPQAALGKVHQ